jgi:hypothetical protein
VDVASPIGVEPAIGRGGDATRAARRSHPAIRPPGKAISIHLPIETFPLYRAADGALGSQPVTVWFVRPSVLPPEHADRLDRVVRQVQQFEHPNLAPVIGLTSWHDPLIAWPRASETLAGAVRAGRCRREDAARLMEPVARALAAAHEERLVHGYLDLEQIALHPTGPAVMGVGIWTCLDLGDANGHFRGGAAELVAPEVRAGARPGARADCYSVAMIFARLLAGDRPIAAPLGRRMFDNMALPILSAALDVDPDRRPSMAEIADQLERLRRIEFYAPAPGPSATCARGSGADFTPQPAPAVPRVRPSAPAGPSVLQLAGFGLFVFVLAAVAFYLASAL